MIDRSHLDGTGFIAGQGTNPWGSRSEVRLFDVLGKSRLMIVGARALDDMRSPGKWGDINHSPARYLSL